MVTHMNFLYQNWLDLFHQKSLKIIYKFDLSIILYHYLKHPVTFKIYY